jgi:hypothetical protein
MVTKLSEVDRDALERALKIAQASEPGEQDARTAAYTCQRRALQLRPWQSPPCYGDASPGHDGHRDSEALLRKLLDAGLSRWEPDPIGALSAIEARAHGDLLPAA